MKLSKSFRLLAFASFGLAILAIAIAPTFLTNDYSPLRNSISESAAQGVENSWIGRGALLLSGIGVIAVAIVKRHAWSLVVSIPIWVFGSSWILTAAFSTKPWMADAPYNQLESDIHSVFASFMAIIVLPSLLLAFNPMGIPRSKRLWYGSLASAATFLPLAGLILPELTGLLQRLMFLFTYGWFIRESIDEA